MSDDVSTVLLNVSAEMAPVFEWAEGLRAGMERSGWSPTLAEAIAGDLLLHILHKALGVGG